MAQRIASEDYLNDIQTLLQPSEILEQGHPEHRIQSLPWSRHAELNPTLVLQPTSLERMQNIIKFLYNSNLDFAVRNTGTGSVSAQDIILSTHGFKSFEFNDKDEVVVGAGLDWGEVDELMEEEAKGFAVVGARCPWVGVTGSALVGGLSWLSHEYGMSEYSIIEWNPWSDLCCCRYDF
jgi:FAD/FMN-containing dehydrogenase